jgi:hypothetical protein
MGSIIFYPTTGDFDENRMKLTAFVNTRKKADSDLSSMSKKRPVYSGLIKYFENVGPPVQI